MGSPEIAPFHRLLKDRPEAGLEASAAPSDLLLKSRQTQTCILSQTVWLNGFVITAQTITRDLRGKHGDVISAAISSFFGSVQSPH